MPCACTVKYPKHSIGGAKNQTTRVGQWIEIEKTTRAMMYRIASGELTKRADGCRRISEKIRDQRDRRIIYSRTETHPTRKRSRRCVPKELLQGISICGVNQQMSEVDERIAPGGRAFHNIFKTLSGHMKNNERWRRKDAPMAVRAGAVAEGFRRLPFDHGRLHRAYRPRVGCRL